MFRRFLLRLLLPRKYWWLTAEPILLSDEEEAWIKAYAADQIKVLQLMRVPDHLRLSALVERLKVEK